MHPARLRAFRRLPITHRHTTAAGGISSQRRLLHQTAKLATGGPADNEPKPHSSHSRSTPNHSSNAKPSSDYQTANPSWDKNTSHPEPPEDTVSASPPKGDVNESSNSSAPHHGIPDRDHSDTPQERQVHSGAQPRFNTMPQEEQSEDVRKHNQEVEERRQVSREHGSIEGDRGGKAFWSGTGKGD